MKMHNPPHPGEVLWAFCLEPLGLTVTAAARALGVGHRRIVTRHMLPSALSPLIVASALGVADSVVAEAALSFLGFGISLPEASLGNMLNNAQTYFIRAPLLVFLPGFVLILIVLVFVLVVFVLVFVLVVVIVAACRWGDDNRTGPWSWVDRRHLARRRRDVDRRCWVDGGIAGRIDGWVDGPNG